MSQYDKDKQVETSNNTLSEEMDNDNDEKDGPSEEKQLLDKDDPLSMEKRLETGEGIDPRLVEWATQIDAKLNTANRYLGQARKQPRMLLLLRQCTQEILAMIGEMKEHAVPFSKEYHDDIQRALQNVLPVLSTSPHSIESSSKETPCEFVLCDVVMGYIGLIDSAEIVAYCQKEEKTYLKLDTQWNESIQIMEANTRYTRKKRLQCAMCICCCPCMTLVFPRRVLDSVLCCCEWWCSDR